MHAEWSVFFDVIKIKQTGNHLVLEATEEERKDLARRFGITEISTLKAKLFINNVRPKQYTHITGTMTASLEQECVVSAEPITTQINEEIEGWYADPDKVVSFNKARREKSIRDGDEIQMLEESEDPDPIIEGQIDLGAFVTEHLSLAIPAYPRKEGVEYEGDSFDQTAEEPAFDNPFAKLAEWKDKFGDK